MLPELIRFAQADAATVRRGWRFWQVFWCQERRLPATKVPLGGSAAVSGR
jgi:hypothetical protein